MNKTQFNDLLSYLRNRPTEAERLKAVLMGESEAQAPQPNQPQPDQWLTAKEVGEQIGQSAKWVKERLQSLPPGTYERRGNRGTWWINTTVNIDQLIRMRV